MQHFKFSRKKLLDIILLEANLQIRLFLFTFHFNSISFINQSGCIVFLVSVSLFILNLTSKALIHKRFFEVSDG